MIAFGANGFAEGEIDYDALAKNVWISCMGPSAHNQNLFATGGTWETKPWSTSASSMFIDEYEPKEFRVSVDYLNQNYAKEDFQEFNEFIQPLMNRDDFELTEKGSIANQAEFDIELDGEKTFHVTANWDDKE